MGPKWCFNYDSCEYEWIDENGYSWDRDEYVYNWDHSPFDDEENERYKNKYLDEEDDEW